MSQQPLSDVNAKVNDQIFGKDKKNKNKPQNNNNLKGNAPEKTSNDKLTEKQLRKLEWEKKLKERELETDVKSDADKTLSKAELKAKRREQQEAQRQAKTDKSKVIEQVPEKPIVSKIAKLPPELPYLNTHKTPLKKSFEASRTNPKQVQLVKHLYRIPNLEHQSKIVNFKDIHPVFVRLGVQYSEKVILGSNARALALLSAIKTLINDIQTPSKQEFCRYFQAILQSCTDYIQDCRPFAVSMTNALRAFKHQLRHIDTNHSDNEKRAILLEFIETYVRNDMLKAWDAICMKVNEKILNGDVILIYGCSSLIRRILLEAYKDGKHFSVIIVDSRPLLEGREMLRRLAVAGIKCSYAIINSLSCVMKQATKVLLGAHALLTNGSVMSRIGTAQVALVAQAYNKPVLVCCETYKFSERVQTDSFVYNEIGDPDLFLNIDTSSNSNPLVSQKDNNKLNILNLLYDVTPPDLVTAVVTELAILPCTSVPAVLRINAGENSI
ncbi:hypothetical protein ABEB36_013616 [Hypothenemus hampei]|uniref:Translation initiation factor eIF2B subunit delta n=1 Tax=Hypothenemus hampei TaxID=57062 RepID=A0ABD1E4Y6_HYPHA